MFEIKISINLFETSDSNLINDSNLFYIYLDNSDASRTFAVFGNLFVINAIAI
jgi:hypothetical protein